MDDNDHEHKSSNASSDNTKAPHTVRVLTSKDNQLPNQVVIDNTILAKMINDTVAASVTDTPRNFPSAIPTVPLNNVHIPQQYAPPPQTQQHAPPTTNYTPPTHQYAPPIQNHTPKTEHRKRNDTTTPLYKRL
ncbi:hypothetical protein K3495_g14793 [Podosphaera aphanis]|nr:hypothetical protein K3495_g14793 [Podosphaera aphanis]